MTGPAPRWRLPPHRGFGRNHNQDHNGENHMNTTTRLMLLACLSLPLLAACQDDGAAVEEQATVEQAPLTAPTTADDNEWAAYLSDVVRRNMGEITNSPYVYYLPGSQSEGYEGQRERLAEEVEIAMMRGVQPGNMIAFASPESTAMADIVVAAFEPVDEGAMKGVKVLFIGDAADEARVRDAVALAGVDFQFVEAR